MSNTDNPASEAPPVARDWPIQIGHDYMEICGQMFHDPACLACALEGTGWSARIRIVDTDKPLNVLNAR